MKRLLSLALTLGGFAGIQATPVTIDNFNTDQLLNIPTGGISPVTVTGSVATGANAIGGFRTVELTRLTGASAAEVYVFGGIAAFSTNSGTTARATLTWDGDSDTALNATGLGGVDLTAGGSNIYMYLGMQADHSGAPIIITVYTDAGNASVATVNTVSGGSFTGNQILLSSFTPILGSGADFANIGAIQLLIDGSGTPSLDAQLDLLETTEAPEPSTVVLIAAGLGLTYFGRRKRA